jgi:hypothetical protein
MTVLSIFILLTYSVEKVYKQTHVHRLDWPIRWHEEPPSLGVPKNDVTRSVLIVVDAQPAGNNPQILKSANCVDYSAFWR